MLYITTSTKTIMNVYHTHTTNKAPKHRHTPQNRERENNQPRENTIKEKKQQDDNTSDDTQYRHTPARVKNRNFRQKN